MAINTGIIRVQIVDAEGNERDDSEVKLRFTADTSELDRELRKSEGRIARIVDNTNRGLVLANNLNRVTGGAAFATAGAALGTRTGRRVTGGLARTAVRGGISGGAFALGRAAAGGVGAAALAAPIAAILAIAAGVTALVGLARVANRETDKQAKLLSQLLIQSQRTNTSLQTIETQARREQDPFQRGAGFQRARIAALGVGITANQIRSSAELQNANNELAESRAALSRTVSLFAGPLKTISADIRAGLNRGLNNLLRGVQDFAGGDQDARIPRGGGFFRSTTSLLGDVARFGRSIPDLGRGIISPRIARGIGFRGFTGRDDIPGISRDPATSGFLGGEQQRRLFRLQFRGPGQILTPSPTVRAGGESEYQFRVQRQRFALQQEITRKWQQEVLQVLRRLARDGEGGITDDDVFRAFVQFGEPRGGVD